MRTIRKLLIFPFIILGSACTILGIQPLAGLNPTPTPVPQATSTPALVPTTCGFQPSYQERSEIANQIQQALTRQEIPALAVSMTSYGDAYVCSDGTSTLLPQTSIVKVTLSVENLEDQQTMGNYARQVLEIPAVLASSGEVQFIFQSSFEQVVLPVLTETAKNAIAGNLQGRQFWLRLLQSRMGQYVYSLAFSPDGRTLASTSQDGFVRLWNVTDGALLQAVYQEQGDKASNVVFTPGGEELVYASGCDIVFRGAGSGVVTRRLVGQFCDVQALQISPDGLYVAVSSDSGTLLQVWRLGENRLMASITDIGITSLAFSPSGDRLAAGSAQNAVLFWQVNDLEEGKLEPVIQLSLQPPLAGQHCPVDSLTFSPDGEKIALAFCSRYAQVWQPAGLTQLLTIEDMVYAVDFSSQGERLALGVSQGAQVVAADTGDLLMAFDQPQGDPEAAHAWVVRFSPDGNILAAGYNGVVRLWRVADGELLLTLGVEGQE